MNPQEVRAPRLRLMVNNAEVLGTTSAEIVQTALCSAGRYALTISTTEVPNLGVKYWSDVARVHLKVQVSLNRDLPYNDLIEGYCDSIRIDPILGLTHIEGRDLSVSLLESRTPGSFQNKTSSEIVAELARAHGLDPVITATSSLVGRYYAGDHNILSLAQSARLATDWDMLVMLAYTEGHDVFVKGRSLYFQPHNPPGAQVLPIYYDNLITLRMGRHLPLNDGVQVTVKSWNSKGSYVVSESTGGTGSAPSSSQYLRTYSAIRPGLTSDEATSLGRRMSDSVSIHSKYIEFTMLGDTSLNPRQSIRLLGTRTAFDQLYQIESITRRFRVQGGYTQMVRATRMAEIAA